MIIILIKEKLHNKIGKIIKYRYCLANRLSSNFFNIRIKPIYVNQARKKYKISKLRPEKETYIRILLIHNC